jgi:hypothetical protein
VGFLVFSLAPPHTTAAQMPAAGRYKGGRGAGGSSDVLRFTALVVAFTLASWIW